MQHQQGQNPNRHQKTTKNIIIIIIIIIIMTKNAISEQRAHMCYRYYYNTLINIQHAG